MIDEIIPAIKFQNAHQVSSGHGSRAHSHRDSDDEEAKLAKVPIRRLSRFEKRMGCNIKDLTRMDTRKHIEAVLVSKEQEKMKADMVEAYKDQQINDKIMAFA